MPAHRPAASSSGSAPLNVISAIQKKPAWLIPMLGGVIILIMLTVLIAVPAPQRQTRDDENVLETNAQPTAAPSTHDADAIKYVNERYGFALYFPKQWAEKYSVTESPEGISVRYTASGQSVELFTMMAMTEEAWRNSTDKPYLLSSKKGIVFAYVTPAIDSNPFGETDPAGTFLKEYRSLLAEVPKLMQSFEFIR